MIIKILFASHFKKGIKSRISTINISGLEHTVINPKRTARKAAFIYHKFNHKIGNCI